MSAYDFIVVGNGSVGMTIALEYATRHPEARVLVVGPSMRHGAASLAAGAMINYFAEIDTPLPRGSVSQARFELAYRAAALWDDHARFLSSFGGPEIRVDWGTLVIRSGAGSRFDDEAFSALVATLEQYDQPIRRASESDMSVLKTMNQFRPLDGVWVPDGKVDSARVIEALETALLASGVTLMDAEVTRLKRTGNKEVTVEIASGGGATATAPAVVVAAGAFNDQLMQPHDDLRNEVMPVFYGAGLGLEISLPDWLQPDQQLTNLNHVVRTQNRGGACGYHLIPLGDNRFYFGASSGVWAQPEAAPRMHAIDFLASGAVEQFHRDLFYGNVTLRGTGYRPVSLDAQPVIGPTPWAGLWVATGTKRDGFTCAPLIAKELVDVIEGNTSAILEPWDPCRNPYSFMDQEAAMRRSTLEAYGALLMHRFVLPNFAEEEWMRRQAQAVAQVYERRNIANFGIHPELLHLYADDNTFEMRIRTHLGANYKARKSEVIKKRVRKALS